MSQGVGAVRLEDLREGWNIPGDEKRQHLQREYELELPLEHPLAGIPVRVIAHRDCNDDVLFEHLNSGLFSVVHLTWRMKRELPNFPTVDFTGSFAAFLAWEGVKPKQIDHG